jgi:glutamate formiminotransferase
MPQVSPLIECIPNFSEGRRPEVVAAVVAAIESVPGVMLFGAESDPDHHRSVVTFAGAPEVVAEAAFQSARRAAELIDLTRHSGAHPRIGATDVLPFVPLRDSDMSQCVALARAVGRRIADELNIPVFCYENAALRPERTNLAHIRRGEFEGLRATMTSDPDRAPDFGPACIHPTAGATAVGARDFLVAFNVNLHTTNLDVARKVARAVRASDGGLLGVKAMGVRLETRGLVQVSMNLTRVSKTPIHRAFELVAREAKRFGVEVAGGELIGFVPRFAVADCFDYFLRMENFSERRIIETQLEERAGAPASGVRPALRPVVEPRPPSVAELALAAALAACHTAADDADDAEQLRQMKAQIEGLASTVAQHAEEERQSRDAIEETAWLPKRTDAERLAWTTAVREAASLAATAHLRTASDAYALLETLLELSDLRRSADVAAAAQFALTTVRTARYGALETLADNADADAEECRNRFSDLLHAAEVLAMQIELRFTARF